jgi:hypothetical protein
MATNSKRFETLALYVGPDPTTGADILADFCRALEKANEIGAAEVREAA